MLEMIRHGLAIAMLMNVALMLAGWLWLRK